VSLKLQHNSIITTNIIMCCQSAYRVDDDFALFN